MQRIRRITAALALTTAAVTGLTLTQDASAAPQDDTTWSAPATTDDTTWGTPPVDAGITVTITITPFDTTWG